MKVRNLKIIIPQVVWQFHPDPFVEYEASDERWAKTLGFGCPVQQPITIEIPLANYDPKTNTYTAIIDEENLPPLYSFEVPPSEVRA